MERRTFTSHLLATVAGYALFDSLFATQAFSNSIAPITNHWALRLHEYCSDLKKSGITTQEWQTFVENLYREIPLEDIVQFIQFEQLAKDFTYPDLGVQTKMVKFPKLEGLPENTVFVKKIFGMKKDRAIIPHGHVNMASAHLILKGEMHLRNYEKMETEEKHLIIQPTVDKTIKLGESSSISDDKNNIHWFIAHTETAFTFDVIMLNLKNKPYDIYNLDIEKKQDLGNGTMRVPILDVDTALQKYGKLTHH
jgi:hypothetical protein